MKRLFKWVLAVFLYYTGILWLFEKFNSYSKENWRILEYRRVGNYKDEIFVTSIPLYHFKRQMSYLRAKYNVISLKEAVERIASHKKLPLRCVTITFDDGYRDTYLNAYLVLKQLNLNATIFLATDYIGSDALLWFDEMMETIKASSVKRIAISGNKDEESFSLSSASERKVFTLHLLEIMQRIKAGERKKYLLELKSLLEVDKKENPEKKLISWEEAKEMSQNNIDFGSHGRSHTILSILNEEELKAELKDSKKIIEDNLKKPVFLFSYPNGREEDFNNIIISELFKAGYKASCTSILGTNMGRINLFKLKRIGIERASSSSFFGLYSRAIFACEMSGILDLLFFREEREGYC